VVRTNESFTVAGWVFPAAAPTRPMTVFSQMGSTNSGFAVRYTPDGVDGQSGWQIEVPDRDASGAVRTVAGSTSCKVCTGDTSGDHLTITYDADTGTVTLWVNGSRQATAHATAFNAAGPMQLGAGFADGQRSEFYSGAISDVWAFTGVVSDDGIGILAQDADTPTYPSPS
jgi:hypothetical protein